MIVPTRKTETKKKTKELVNKKKIEDKNIVTTFVNKINTSICENEIMVYYDTSLIRTIL
jgi:peroxiredoxin